MDAETCMRQFVAARAEAKRNAAAERTQKFLDALPALVQGALEQDPDISLIILFGSLSSEKPANAGDIDLAIRSQKFLKVAGWLLRQEVPVDVVDIDEVYNHIRERILIDGKVLYER